MRELLLGSRPTASSRYLRCSRTQTWGSKVSKRRPVTAGCLLFGLPIRKRQYTLRRLGSFQVSSPVFLAIVAKRSLFLLQILQKKNRVPHGTRLGPHFAVKSRIRTSGRLCVPDSCRGGLFDHPFFLPTFPPRPLVMWYPRKRYLCF